MARSVNEKEYAEKRNQILEVAQRLIYSKGYEQMSIQDILNDLQISKGAFYHYFDSKQALLEALIDRMQAEAEPLIAPIVSDPQLSALDKLHRFYNTSARWKTARKDYLILLMRGWYADENALVREKAQTRMIRYFGRMVADIIRQGVQEGVMNTPYPDQMGEMTLNLLQSLGNDFMERLFNPTSTSADLQHVYELVAAYNTALERMLGTPPGSLNLVDMSIMKDWFETSPEASPARTGRDDLKNEVQE